MHDNITPVTIERRWVCLLVFHAIGSKIVGSLLGVACGIGLRRRRVGIGRAAAGGASSRVMNAGAVGGVTSSIARTATVGHAPLIAFPNHLPPLERLPPLEVVHSCPLLERFPSSAPLEVSFFAAPLLMVAG